ncbi:MULTISPECIES: DUF2845 domain-containing protein [unclassified Pseudomonas]|jgi:hypothetical protein|uniref:DUF2845 domain-containing protein n=1 Tax=unclassified Pseudomonas TaxID=196821 RepID=UPI0012F100FF|nr:MULTISPECIES: DUF2845 domain-containing protein [unclassified Pseudomonas]NMY50978.1 DUF2845 domain-containing protein [Pseudomonas sp. WS 5011]VXC99193.1 conserved exported hypothetical protein [Pseudomonas sp. 9AZ]
MKAFISALLLLVPFCAQASSTLRCDSGLVSLDDTTSEVSSKCGEPLSRDFLGYREVLDEYGFYNEVAVEEWSYGPRNGMYQFLRFQGNRLIKIDSKRGN